MRAVGVGYHHLGRLLQLNEQRSGGESEEMQQIFQALEEVRKELNL